MSVLIAFASDQGEEREERWPSVAAFRAWALGQDGRYRYRAYVADEDGEWVPIEDGVAGRGL